MGSAETSRQIITNLINCIIKALALKLQKTGYIYLTKQQNFNEYIKIIDLYDSDNNPRGTRVEVKIKAV